MKIKVLDKSSVYKFRGNGVMFWTNSSLTTNSDTYYRYIGVNKV